MQSNRRGEHAVPMYGNERIGEQDNSTRHFVRKNNKHPIYEFTNWNIALSVSTKRLPLLLLIPFQ